MKKPQPKAEVRIVSYGNGEIIFYASNELLKEVEDFGSIMGFPNGVQTLTVDSRYDFEEVLEYMKSYEK